MLNLVGFWQGSIIEKSFIESVVTNPGVLGAVGGQWRADKGTPKHVPGVRGIHYNPAVLQPAQEVG